MGATYTRQSSSTIVDGATIEASHFNDEFDQLVTAFAADTGHTHDGTSAEGGDVTKLLGTAITIGDGTAGTDIAVTFDGETNDGLLTWMEDEDYFKFSDDILVNSTEKLMFQDTGTYIYSNADGDLDLVSDGTAIDSINIESAGGITLDAGSTTHGITYEDDGTPMLQITNSSSDVVIKPLVDAKDIIFQQYDGTEVARIEDNATFNVSSAGKFAYAGTAVTTTAAELNLIDGGTARGTTSVASGDGILINDAGTMRMTDVDTVSTYFASHSVGGSSIVTTGALDSGSITSGFGAIDNGTSGIRTNTFTAETSIVPDASDGATLGSASLEWSDLYLADSAIIYFGDDQEITLTHVPDDGLIIKHVGTGDGKEPSLTFQAGDTDIAVNDVLGSIFFQAPDEGAGTDAILVAAGIEAVSEGDFSSSNNATKLSFKTAASEAASEKMSLSSAGLLTVADDIVFKDGGTIGVTSATDAMTVSSGGIVTFKDDILIKDGGTIGSASDADAISISSGGVVTFTQNPVFPDGGIDVADLDIDGATDIGEAIVDADLFIIDNGAGGTNRKTTASRLKTYIGTTDLTSIESNIVPDGSGTRDIGTSSAEWDDLYLADSSVIYFGNDQEITLTHVADTGVNLKHAATADDKFPTLTLQTGDTDIASADKLGVINFQAPDEGAGTDAILVAAGIEAVSEGNFAADNNATKLSFKTAASAAAAETASLSSTGVFTATSFSGSGAGLTAGTTPVTTLDIDGATDIGEAIVDADLFIIDNGAGGTNRKTTASRLKTYIGGGADPDSADGDSLGTASLEWSDLYLADGGIIYFGNDQEITLTHVADTGLTLKHAASGDDKYPTLTFQTGDTDIAVNDVLGAINFQAPDEGAGTDAVLVAASIEAVSEGNFAADNNATKLSFKVASSETAAEKMKLPSNARLATEGGFLAPFDGDFAGTKGFVLNPTSMRLDLITSGTVVNECVRINKTGSDGDIITFFQAGTEEGYIAVSGSTVSYNTFTGAHEGQWETDISDPPEGTLISTVDGIINRIVETFKDEEGMTDVRTVKSTDPQPEGATRRIAPKPQLTKIKITDKQADSRVYGVFGARRKQGEGISVYAIGSAMVRVKGAISGGDLIQSSATAGVAEKQSDDVIRASTIGKVSRGDDETGERLVACVLYSG